MRISLSIACLAFFLTGFAQAGDEQPHLRAAGSTAINPMIIKWSREFQKAEKKRVDFESLGSGNGIKKLIQG